MLRLAEVGGVSRADATDIIERTLEQVGNFSAVASEHPIRRATITTMRRAVEANRLALA